MGKNRRTRKLILPALQLKLALVFLTAAGCAVLAQALLLTWTLNQLAASMPSDGEALRSEIPGILRTNLILTFSLLVPSMLFVGVLATFHLAGPLYRFRNFLQSVVRGGSPSPLVLRTSDELQDIAELINLATAPMRRSAPVEDLEEHDESHEVDDVKSLVAETELAGEPSPTREA